MNTHGTLMYVFSIYDLKAEAYLRPFFSPTRAMAMRSFEDTVNSPDSMMNAHPDDFTLFELGSWDQLAGSITMYEQKVGLGTALQYLHVSVDPPREHVRALNQGTPVSKENN